jgi:hypothetical protein
MVVMLVMSTEWSSGMFATGPLLWVGLLWVFVAIAVDNNILSSTPANMQVKIAEQKQEVKQSFMSVVGSVFAFSMLLNIIAGNAEGGGRSRRTAFIGIMALLMGLAFITPVFDTREDSVVSHVVVDVMKLAALFATAIFMLAIVVEMHSDISRIRVGGEGRRARPHRRAAP